MKSFGKNILLFVIIIFAFQNNYGQNSDFNPWLRFKLNISSYPNCISIDNKNRIYIGTDDGQVLKSDDGGISFEQIFESESHDPISCILNTSYGKIYVGVSYPGGCLVVSRGNEGVYESSNDGNSWNRIIETIWVNSLIESKNGEVFVCANKSNLVTDNYISKDKGKSWQNLNFGLPKDYITEFYLDRFYDLYAIDFHNGIYKLDIINNEWKIWCDKVPTKYISNFARTSNGIEFINDSEYGFFKSSDNFKTYSKINFTLDHSISSIIINTKNEIFLSTAGYGMFFSSDFGDSWVAFNKSLLNSRYLGAMTFDKEEYLYVLGHRLGAENESDDVFEAIKYDLEVTDYVLYKTSNSTIDDKPLIR